MRVLCFGRSSALLRKFSIPYQVRLAALLSLISSCYLDAQKKRTEGIDNKVLLRCLSNFTFPSWHHRMSQSFLEALHLCPGDARDLSSCHHVASLEHSRVFELRKLEGKQRGGDLEEFELV